MQLLLSRVLHVSQPDDRVIVECRHHYHHHRHHRAQWTPAGIARGHLLYLEML